MLYGNTMKKLGKYHIDMTKLLGQGSHGKVYEGQNTETHQKVAVKLIPKLLIDQDQHSQSAFSEQIRNMFVLKSQNIVMFIDVLKSANNYYLIQEYCNGHNLRKLIDTKGPFSQENSISILKQVCNGFTSLIRQKVSHRDLKPENILLHNGIIKISDFGYSKRFKTDQNALMVSKIYASPVYKSIQVLKSEPYSEKCDIWALGVIFYEMLHKRTPWEGQSEIQLIKNIQTKPLKISSQFSPNIHSFLQMTLKIKQKDRICWDEVLGHPIFNNIFDSYFRIKNQLQHKLIQVLNQIKLVVVQHNLDISTLLLKQGFNGESELNFEQFRSFLKKLQVPTSFSECKYAFDAIDVDNSHKISIKQLEQVFIKHNIPLKSDIKIGNIQINDWNSSQPLSPGPIIIEGISQIYPPQSIQNKLKRAFIKINQIIISDQKQLYQYYDEYDVRKEGDLTIPDITKMLTQLDATFTALQIQHAFQIIDSSDNHNISYNEFNKFYCQCLGLPNSTVHKYTM